NSLRKRNQISARCASSWKHEPKLLLGPNQSSIAIWAVIRARCDRRKYLVDGITRLHLLPPLRRPSDQARRLQTEPQLPQRSANERAICKLILQQGMRPSTVLRLNNLAVGIDPLGQARNSVGGLTTLRQKLNTSGIIDPKFGLERSPK